MAKSKKQTVETNDYMQKILNSGNTEYINFVLAQKDSGRKFMNKGEGYIARVYVDCAYGYNVFASDANKTKYIEILNRSADTQVAAITVAYSVTERGAALLVKGDNQETVKTFVMAVNTIFEKEYDGGRRSIGYPFRMNLRIERVLGSSAIEKSLATVLSYMPDAYLEAGCVNIGQNPYCSLESLLSGGLPSMVLGAELGLYSRTDVLNLVSGCVGASYPHNSAPEKLNPTFNFLYERYVGDFKIAKEKELSLILSETASRTKTPFKVVAKKARLDRNRRDLIITTFADYLNRRRCGYFSAREQLGLVEMDEYKLIIETFVQLNTEHDYSYQYIMTKIFLMNDENYQILVKTFITVHNKLGYDFATLCEKFHVTRDIMVIRGLCGF